MARRPHPSTPVAPHLFPRGDTLDTGYDRSVTFRWHSRGAGLRRPIYAATCLAVFIAAHPASQVDYVLTQAVYQVGMLLQRQPVEQVLAQGAVSPQRLARLRLVDDVRRFAIDEVGLASLDSYTSVSVGFERRMYNVLACEPDRFQPHSRWFPIVGSIPYIGYFRLADTQREVRRLEAMGFDVSARPVGAYSTLGWFDDPILPAMLDWEEHRLADTLIHESAHATLFLRGQMEFNESFARFVGDEGARRFVQGRRDVAPQAYRIAAQDWGDRALFDALLFDLYHDLDALYGQDLPRQEILARKGQLLTEADAVCRSLPFEQDRYRQAFQRLDVNNATLMTMKTYHSGIDAFSALLARCATRRST